MQRLWQKASVSTLTKALLWLSVAALVLGALPLYLIAPYNHPYYDDYGFSYRVHEAWQQTDDVGAALAAAWRSARDTRMSWQGTYTGTLLSNLQPGVLDEGLYWLGNVFLLTAFIGCFVCFFVTVFGRLGMERRARWTLGCMATALMVQLMPDVGEAFFWFNGGVGNAFIYALLALAAALMVRLLHSERRAGTVGLMAALCLLMVLLGGGSYGGGLFGLCGLALWVTWLMRRRHPRRWHMAALLMLFLGCFLYSVCAPGNGVRASVIGYHASPVKAVLQGLYYGMAQIGTYMRLPLLGATLLLLPALYRAAKQSAFSFRCPWGVGLMLYALYCTQLVPPLYSIAGIGAGRIVNTYFISFVALWFGYVYYLCGAAARWLTRHEATLPALTARRYGALLLCGLCLTGVGCLGVKPHNEPLYGVQNLSGISAALSLLNGEAAQYHRDMLAREALLSDPAQPEVTLETLTRVPDVFMDDLIQPNAVYDVRPSLYLYYPKQAIHIAGEEGAP